MDIERRFITSELRADESGPIVGYAAVFNQLSVDLGGFRELIRPGAFATAIREDDVRALWNHDSNYVLGRNTAGTLTLQEDDHGLRVRVDPPATQWAEDLRQSIRRGDVNQMSFAFQTVEDRWQREDGENRRELIEVRLYDVSPVTYPAYEGTAVSARALTMCDELTQQSEPGSEAEGGQEPGNDGEDAAPQARAANRRYRLKIAQRKI